MSYTTLTALASDNGYRIIIVLAGTKNALLEQTYLRLSSDLKHGSSGTLPTLTLFKNPGVQDSGVIERVLKNGRNVLIVALKHQDRIASIERIMREPTIGTLPALIIDDEGDEASLKNSSGKSSSNSVNQNIIGLRNSLKVHGYVSYTATPEANLLISKIDELSPDFAVLIKPGDGYCGGSTFFGDTKDKYVKSVDQAEGELQAKGKISKGLKEALAVFFVGSAVRAKLSSESGEGVQYHSMLIHTSLKQADHEVLKDALQPFLKSWEDIMTLADNDPSKKDLMSIFREAYRELSQTVKEIPGFDDLQYELAQSLSNYELWMVNSTPRGKDPVQLPFRLPNNILVGGNMLGRGVTIPGLAVTYITREAKSDTNADTLEQRARWFGYKEKYLDFCRIYLTARLKDKYTELLSHEDDLWETLERNEAEGIKVKDWPPMFRLNTKDLKLKPTRSSVARTRSFRGRKWDRQELVTVDKETASNNVKAVKSFFSSFKGSIKSYGGVKHLDLSGCGTMAVAANLLSQVNTDGTDWENDYTIEYLTRLFYKGRLPAIEVLLMSQDILGEFRYRERTYTDAGRISLMQGRSEKRDKSDPLYYPGDDNIHGGKPQLQVNLIKAVEKSSGDIVETTAFALFIPDDPFYDLKLIVRGNGN